MSALKEIFGGLLIISSIFDALKYTIQANKIRKEGTARAMSRRFINWALFNDVIKLGYGIIIFDAYIVASTILALVCMSQLFWTIYVFYPYRKRTQFGFKRPNIMLYFWNSLLPNSIRKKL